MYNFRQILSENHLKATSQRLFILNLLNQEGHLSIEEIYEELKQLMPTVSLATVYKNIAVLKEAGIVNEISIKNEKPKFEITKREHGHFVCKICGSVIDFDLDSIAVDNAEFAVIERSEVFLYGICSKCFKIEQKHSCND